MSSAQRATVFNQQQSTGQISGLVGGLANRRVDLGQPTQLVTESSEETDALLHLRACPRDFFKEAN
jgi:hypothetical protein